jgi:dTDP-4-dehydrorhamnose reductase
MIAIIGSNGQLGWELVRQAEGKGLQSLALDFPEIDITSSVSISDKLDPHPVDIVVNAAAYTAVDKAESEPDAAFAVNCKGSENLAQYCSRRDIALVHVSTDYIFDGTKQGPYHEKDAVAPLGVYGKSKEAGEAAIREKLLNHIVIRTAWLYGFHGQNFVKTMLRLGRERQNLSVVNDQHGCPTYAADLAEAMLRIIELYREKQDIVWGTYHFCGEGPTTWHAFAERIFMEARRYESLEVKEVIPVTTKEYPTPAKRPANSVLDCSKIMRNFGIHPRPWQNALEEMIARLYTAESPRS